MTLFGKLLRDTRGVMAVETAVTLPFLFLLGFGSFQVGSAVARQSELQGAAAEAEQIVLATKPKTTGELNNISSILQTSTGLGSSHVTVAFRYRCGTGDTLYTTSGNCDNTTQEWVYVHIALTDTYHPMWTQLGVGSDINYSVIRMAQVS